VLNKKYKPDDKYYALPYPRMGVIYADDVIRGKLFVEASRSRVGSKAVLEYAKVHLLK
jgi:hypothetical protein